MMEGLDIGTCRSKWTLEYLAEQVGDRKVRGILGPHPSGKRLPWTLTCFVSRLLCMSAMFGVWISTRKTSGTRR